MVRAYQSEDRASDTSNKLEQLSFKNSEDKDVPMEERRKADLFSKQPTSPTSPLLMMQKNYQDRIYAEKEKKMIEIFKKNQQSSLQTISDKSSKQVKSYFGKKLERPKKYQNSEKSYQKDTTTTSGSNMGSQKMLAKHLPPLVNNRKADSSLEDGDKASLGGNETKGSSKRLSKLTIHKSKVKSVSNEQAMNSQSPVNHLDNSNGDNDLMNDCLRLIRDKRVKEKKQELIKSNNRRMASNRDEVHDQSSTTEEPDLQSKFVTPKTCTNVHRKSRKSKISSFKRPRDSPKASPAPANSNYSADTSKMAPVGGHHSNGRAKYEKPSRNRPFVSISPEERKEINFNETYSKHKRKVEPSTHGNGISKENNPIFGIPNFNKPVKVRRDGRNTSNSTYSAKNYKSQETMKTDISKTKTSDYDSYKQENNLRYDHPKVVSPPVEIDGRSTCNSSYSGKNYKSQESMKTDISMTKTSDYHNYNEENNLRYDNPEVVSPPVEIAQNNSQNASEDYEEVVLDECNFCGRRFAVDRLQKHMNVCQTLKKKKRKVYNMAEARQKGTDMENFKPNPKGNEKETKRKKNWRATHDDLIKTIQHARVITAHVASGGRAIDLPPPPPSSNPDYVHCQYCERRFAPKVAERHIPRCKETKARPPPPKRKNKAKGR